ncbi:hypothetical protein BKA70DRAFT_1417813 [Coprinopsis sp. MPI-PUGE-AT-0042]|nr:hypothetical protein BKA70DRAFT_1417813 [Coprinopsis sp. MPI-PUGE-AT-0042]
MKSALFLAFLTCVVCIPTGGGERRDILGFLAVGEQAQQIHPVDETPLAPGIETVNDTLSIDPTRGLSDLHSAAISLHPHTMHGGASSSTTKAAHTSASASEDVHPTALGSPGDDSVKPMPSFNPLTEEAPTTPPAELAEWKIIGISVMSITFIAIVVILVTFFDTWWAFVKDVFNCGGRKDMGEETLVECPDWKRRTWEVKLASEDGHRYPTMGSLESITKGNMGEVQYDTGAGLDYIGHAEMALGRNMSARMPGREFKNPEW